jgi:hypothetical protein
MEIGISQKKYEVAQQRKNDSCVTEMMRVRGLYRERCIVFNSRIDTVQERKSECVATWNNLLETATSCH